MKLISNSDKGEEYKSRLEHYSANSNTKGCKCSEPFHSGGESQKLRANNVIPRGGDAAGVAIGILEASIHPLHPNSSHPLQCHVLFHCGFGMATHHEQHYVAGGNVNFEASIGGIAPRLLSSAFGRLGGREKGRRKKIF